MINSVFNLTLSLKFESEKSLAWISDFLGVLPTTYAQKGNSEHDFIDANKDVWALTKKYEEYDGSIPLDISNFFESISDISQKLEIIRQNAICSFRISIVSDWAQNGFALHPDDLVYLSRLSIPIEVSFFSWGRCVDE